MDKIHAKKWLISQWKKYEIKSIKEESEFIGLLNILQSHGLTLEDMHRCVVNGEREFMTFISTSDGWNTLDELYKAILEYNTFFTEKEFVNWILEWQEELNSEGDDPAEVIKEWTYSEDWLYEGHPVNVMIVKTEDGYVKQEIY